MNNFFQNANDGERSGDLQQQNSTESTSPEFGLVDVIEAFTAMRHECRTQTRENRDLSAAIQQATDNLLQLEAKLIVPATQNAEPSGVRELIDAIVEIDIHLSRAVEATLQAKRASSLSDPLSDAIELEFGSRNVISRWFCRRFFKSVLRIVTRHRQENADDSTGEGLMMVISRIRRIMSDREIERTETVGQPFDATTMHAIASVQSDQQPSGHVDEQMSSAYFWRGELFRYAEVRVAK